MWYCVAVGSCRPAWHSSIQYDLRGRRVRAGDDNNGARSGLFERHKILRLDILVRAENLLPAPSGACFAASVRDELSRKASSMVRRRWATTYFLRVKTIYISLHIPTS